MRDLEEVQRELQATTSETRMSAWVLALLPVGACDGYWLGKPGMEAVYLERNR